MSGPEPRDRVENATPPESRSNYPETPWGTLLPYKDPFVCFLRSWKNRHRCPGDDNSSILRPFPHNSLPGLDPGEWWRHTGKPVSPLKEPVTPALSFSGLTVRWCIKDTNPKPTEGKVLMKT